MMNFNRFSSEKKYDSESARESAGAHAGNQLYRCVFKRFGVKTGNPVLAMTICSDTVRRKVLFPAMFAPVIMKNCSLSIL